MCPLLMKVVWILILTNYVKCNYRSVSVNNVDVCRGRSNTLGKLFTSSDGIEIGEGAAIFELQNPSKELQPEYRNKRKQCEIQIKAPEGHGLTAYIEEMHMRRSSKDQDCIDFIQFGQDDNIPFITMAKSKRICGGISGKTNASNGFFYDDPRGNLLVWINLGGRRNTRHYGGISDVHLTLIVTAYKKQCVAKPGLSLGYLDSTSITSKRRKCGELSNDVCILKDYFCDRRFNCPRSSPSQHLTNDELDCNYDRTTTLPPGQDVFEDGLGITFGNLNLLSWILIIICIFCVPLILCLAVLRFRKMYSTSRICCDCFGRGLSERSSCELPEGGPQSLVQLSSQRQRHTNDTEQNVYLPLTTFLDQPMQQESRDNNHRRTTDLPEEPPPAYNDLFPEGYAIPLNDSQEIAQIERIASLPDNNYDTHISAVGAQIGTPQNQEITQSRESFDTSQIGQQPLSADTESGQASELDRAPATTNINEGLSNLSEDGDILSYQEDLMATVVNSNEPDVIRNIGVSDPSETSESLPHGHEH